RPPGGSDPHTAPLQRDVWAGRVTPIGDQAETQDAQIEIDGGVEIIRKDLEPQCHLHRPDGGISASRAENLSSHEAAEAPWSAKNKVSSVSRSPTVVRLWAMRPAEGVAGGGRAASGTGGARARRGLRVGVGRPARAGAGAARSGPAAAGRAARQPAGGGRGGAAPADPG